MKQTAAGLCAVLLLVCLAGCGNKTQQIGPEETMELADFNVYSDGQVAMALDSCESGNFLWGWADVYELEPNELQTRRGVSLGDSDYEIVKQYGEILCQIDYKMNGSWNTVYDTSYVGYYGSTLYSKEYTVTFYAFLERGRLQKADDNGFVAVNLGSGKCEQVYGLTFHVEGGVVRNIESYTYET